MHLASRFCSTNTMKKHDNVLISVDAPNLRVLEGQTSSHSVPFMEKDKKENLFQ